MLSILARPDYFITTMILVVFLHLKLNKFFLDAKLLIFATLFIGVYFFSRLNYAGYSSNILLAHTFLGYMPFPEKISLVDIWPSYFKHLRNNLFWLISSVRPFTFMFIGLLTAVYRKSTIFFLGIGAVLNILVKVILFPNIDYGLQERFYFVSYYLIAFAFAEWIFSALEMRFHNKGRPIEMEGILA